MLDHYNGYTESVITTDPSKRKSAVDTLQTTANMLGYSISPETDKRKAQIASGFYNVDFNLPQKHAQTLASEIDYIKLAKALAAELRNAPIQVKTEFNVKQGDAYFDNEKVGKMQAPVISRRLHNSSLVQ